MGTVDEFCLGGVCVCVGGVLCFLGLQVLEWVY